jgi:hypothetical protein
LIDFLLTSVIELILDVVIAMGFKMPATYLVVLHQRKLVAALD